MFNQAMRILTLAFLGLFLVSSCIDKKDERRPASPRLEKEVYVDRAPQEEEAEPERRPERKEEKEEKGEITQQDELLEYVNEHRMRIGLRRLIYSHAIEITAQNHSIRMSRKYFPFGHIGSKLRCRSILKALKIDKGSLCGENVAMGQETPEEAFKAWMNSPEHREAIEDERFTHTGLGIFMDPGGVIYWTQIFVQIN